MLGSSKAGDGAVERKGGREVEGVEMVCKVVGVMSWIRLRSWSSGWVRHGKDEVVWAAWGVAGEYAPRRGRVARVGYGGSGGGGRVQMATALLKRQAQNFPLFFKIEKYWRPTV